MSYEPHPLADLLPVMPDDSFRELVEDIRANGQLQPITLYEGKILDGRHRDRACRELGIAPITEDYTGDNPAGYVLSLNVQRRHLTTSQRAMIATRFLPALKEEARGRQGARVDLTSASFDAEVSSDSTDRPQRSADHAANLVGVSAASVERAARVAEASPAMAERVLAGEMTVTAAAKQVREQAAPLSGRAQNIARAHRDRVNKLAWSLDGYVKGIPAINVDAALSAATDDEVEHWRNVLANAAREFRSLRSALEEA